MTERLRALGNRAANAHLVVNALFDQPVLRVADVTDIINNTPSTVYRLVADLEKVNILHPIKTPGEESVFCFSRVLKFIPLVDNYYCINTQKSRYNYPNKEVKFSNRASTPSIWKQIKTPLPNGYNKAKDHRS